MPIVAGSKMCSSQSTARSYRRGGVPRGARGDAKWAAEDLVSGEKLSHFDCGRLGGIRTMHRVLADGLRMKLADGTVRGFGGIGRSHAPGGLVPRLSPSKN